MKNNSWQSPVFLSDIYTYQDWLAVPNKQNSPNRPSLTNLLEYKIFEDANPGSEPKPVKGCGTCTGNLPKLSPEMIKSLEQQERDRTKTPTDNTGYVNVAAVRAKEQQFYLPSQEQIKFFDEAKKYFTDWFNKPETAKKFKNPGNKQKLIDWINQKLALRVWKKPLVDSAYGWVYSNIPHLINLNAVALESNSNQTKSTIYHEIGHSIDLFLESMGDSPIKGQKVSNFFIPGKTQVTKGIDDDPSNSENKDYIADQMENTTRLRTIRRMWGLSPNANCSEIKQKVESLLGKEKLRFRGISDYEFRQHQSNWWLKLTPDDKWYKGSEPTFLELVRIFCPKGVGFKDVEGGIDTARFFAHLAQFKYGFVWINLCKIAKMNQDLVMKDKDESNGTREA